MKVFCSGSCRLLNVIRNTEDIETLHSLENPAFKGINFMGKLHNTKCHIQFIKFIKGLIELSEENLENFLTAYNYNKYKSIRYIEELSTIPDKLKRLKESIDECDAYIFEICSIKIYKYNDVYCHHEQQVDDITYDMTIQTKEELLEDLYTLKSFFPEKKIIFQCHFRPNIIHDDETKAIPKRELIFNTLTEFCNTNTNCFVYDPSIVIKKDIETFLNVDYHFKGTGHDESFKYLCNNFLLDKPVQN
jgi:hypothetical protein